MQHFRSIFVLLVICLKISDILAQQSDSIAYSIDVDDLIVTAQYKPTHHSQVLYQVDILDQELMQKRGAVQLDQALLISPQIRLEQDMVLGTQVRMRGIGASNVAILIDGIPVTGRLNGAVDVSQIPTQNIQKIEIIDGPMSNIFGNNAAAGVINIITKKSQLNEMTADLSVQTESIGINSFSGRVGYRLDRLTLSLHGRFFEYDQYSMDELRMVEHVPLDNGNTVTQMIHPWNPKEQLGFGCNLRYQIDEDHTLVLKYDNNEEDATDFGVVTRPTFNPYATDGFYNTRRRDLALMYTGLLAKHYHIDLSSGYNQFDRLTESKRFYIETLEFDPTPVYNTQAQTSFDTYFTRLNVGRKFENRWELLAGLTYTNETGSGDRIIDRNRDDSTMANFREQAFYAELKYRPIKNLQIAASGRTIYHSNYELAFTPAIYAKYELSDQLTIRGSYAQGYRNPELKELYIEFIDINHHIIGNDELKPELSHDYRMSVQYEVNDAIDFNLGGYHTHVTDQIGLVEFETLKFRYFNVDNYRVRGIELGGNYVHENFRLQSNAHLGIWGANITDAKDDLDDRHIFDMNHTLTYTIPKPHLGFTVNYRRMGKQANYRLMSDDEVVISEVESASFIDVTANKSFWKERLSLVAGVKNLLDVQNLNVSNAWSSGQGHSAGLGSRPISQGRSFFTSLNIKL